MTPKAGVGREGLFPPLLSYSGTSSLTDQVEEAVCWKMALLLVLQTGPTDGFIQED